MGMCRKLDGARARTSSYFHRLLIVVDCGVVKEEACIFCNSPGRANEMRNGVSNNEVARTVYSMHCMLLYSPIPPPPFFTPSPSAKTRLHRQIGFIVRN